MKKIFISLLIFILSISLSSCKGKNMYRFTYFSGGADYKSSMYYTDEYFESPSTTYNPELSTSSLSLAMACFASSTYNYANKSKNGVALFKALGFKDITPNDYYKKKPEADSFGVIIANKKIGDKTLIAVGTRGANYESEWASNFTIKAEGEDASKATYHAGFYQGSTIYLDALKDYIIANNITGDIKLWGVGYSRAAAVTNIAAGRLDEAIGDQQELAKLLGTGVNLKKEDLYAYCFEAPQGVIFDNFDNYPKTEKFNNIFCIVNYNDPVPKVAMTAFKYCRYGVDIVLPDKMTDINYNEVIAPVIEQYSKMPNSYKLGEYKIDNFLMASNMKFVSLINIGQYKNWQQGLFINDLINQLAIIGIGDLETYGTYLQDGLRETFKMLYSTSSPKASVIDIGINIARSILLENDASIIMDDIVHNPDALVKDVTPLLIKALKKIGVKADTPEIIKSITNFLQSFATTIKNNLRLVIPLFSKDNILGFAAAHYPELCLAHLRAMDKNYNPNPTTPSLNGRYHRLSLFRDKTNVEVKMNGTTVAKIQDGNIIETSSTLPQASYKNTYIGEGYEVIIINNSDIILPGNAHYEVIVEDKDTLIEYYDPNDLFFDFKGIDEFEYKVENGKYIISV